MQSKHGVDRREFLATLAGTAALCAIPSMAIAAMGSTPKKPSLPSMGMILIPMEKELVLVETKTGEVSRISIPNKNPHSVITHPSWPQFAWIVDQENQFLSLVDWKKKKLLQTLELPSNRWFSGHATLPAKGDQLFVVEYPSALDGNGEVIVLEPTTLRTKRKFISGGVRAHNVQLLNDGKTLAVGHAGIPHLYGEPPSGGMLSFLDLDSGKLLETFRPHDPYLFFNHFDVSRSDDVIISSQCYYSFREESGDHREHQVSLITPVLFGKKGSSEWHYLLPSEIRARMRHNHSVVIDQTRNRALVAHAQGQLVSMWDMSTKKFLRTFDLGTDNPRGIAISTDGKYYLINTESSSFLLFSAETFALEAQVPATTWQLRGTAAPHIHVVA